MKKTSITKPQFGKIFIVRFLVLCLIAFIVAVQSFTWLDDYINTEHQRFNQSYRGHVIDRAKKLSETEPGSKEYEECIYQLRVQLAIYQMIDYDYAEVTVGDMKFATDKDTAYMTHYSDDLNSGEFYFIEDMSCLEPLYRFMDGKYNPESIENKINKYYWDPVYMHTAGDSYAQVYYQVKSAYINREKHTFIPCLITISDRHKEFEVDMGAKEIDGYEKVETNNWGILYFSYRMAPELSSKEFQYYALPAVNGSALEGVNPEVFGNIMKQRELPWYIGYSEGRDQALFEYAPYTCVFIMAVAILSAMAIALLLAFIKYQKDKTVWNIFEYRTKTTEAMAHDLKTPMAAISAYAESLEDCAGDPAKTAEYSRKISEKIQSMDHMVEDILMLSKGETGKVEVKREELSVRELINESLKAFPELKTEIKGDDVKIKTDRKLFKQAVDNLLSNSDRYAVEGSTVDIKVEPDRLTITNKTSETYPDVESLKKPFVKGSDSRSDKGTGLGLSIADNNLNILGYKLELVSEDGLFKASVKF